MATLTVTLSQVTYSATGVIKNISVKDIFRFDHSTTTLTFFYNNNQGIASQPFSFLYSTVTLYNGETPPDITTVIADIDEAIASVNANPDLAAIKTNTDTIVSVQADGSQKTQVVGTTGVTAEVTTDGRLMVDSTPAQTSFYSSLGYCAYAVVKGSAGKLYGFSGYNSLTSDQYILVFDSATLPSEATVPLISIIAGGNNNFYLKLDTPIDMSSGIVICNSSTADEKTIGSEDIFLNAQYT